MITIIKSFHPQTHSNPTSLTKQQPLHPFKETEETRTESSTQGNDEIIIEAPVAEIETAAQILKESMIDAGKVYLKTVLVMVDVSVADNWYEK
jgi:DNA polymerase I-like protein with 3'-5' exonuclease and polymerase domains